MESKNQPTNSTNLTNLTNSTNLINLSNEQEDVLELFKQGHNIFITGPGGSGKTFLIKQIYNWCNENHKNIQVCALTGCAAVLLNCNARTIHSWSGIGIGNKNIESVIDSVYKSNFKRKNWNSVEVLVIDEVSMMSHKLLSILDGIARRVKRKDIPFGGIQVIFSGDFYQLPPVGNEHEPETSMFCFENPLWDEIFNSQHQIELKHIFRQTDQSYSFVLNQIREGRLSKSGYNLLMSRVTPCQEDMIKPTKLLPRKDVVNRINYKEMEILKTPETKYMMQVIENISNSNLNDTLNNTFNHKLFKSNNHIKNHHKPNHHLTQEQINITIDMFKNNLMAEKELILKEGAQVMCIVNMDLEGTNPIVNGSRGVVKRFTNEGLPVVKFRCGLEQVIGYHSWTIDGLEGYCIKQIPLILAWAITIHKSQGSTLELAEIDIGSGIFECGQSYVALSRIKSIEGLYLSSFNPNKIRINKKAQEYYLRFKK